MSTNKAISTFWQYANRLGSWKLAFVYQHICIRQDMNQRFCRRSFCAVSGMPYSTIKKAIRELEEMGVVVRRGHSTRIVWGWWDDVLETEKGSERATQKGSERTLKGSERTSTNKEGAQKANVVHLTSFKSAKPKGGI